MHKRSLAAPDPTGADAPAPTEPSCDTIPTMERHGVRLVPTALAAPAPMGQWSDAITRPQRGPPVALNAPARSPVAKNAFRSSTALATALAATPIIRRPLDVREECKRRNHGRPCIIIPTSMGYAETWSARSLDKAAIAGTYECTTWCPILKLPLRG